MDEPQSGVRRWRRSLPIGILAAVVLIAGAIAVSSRSDDALDTVAAAEPIGTTTSSRPGTSTTSSSSSSTIAAVEPPPSTTEPAPVVPSAPVTSRAPTTVTGSGSGAAPEVGPAGSTNPGPSPVIPSGPVPSPAPAPYPSPTGIEPYRGLGVWLDVLDWSPSYTGGRQSVDPSAVDRMADLGVQTIYIQTSRYNRAEDIIDPAVLGQFIDRAHGRGLRVVAWYMPTHEDHDADVRRLVAAAGLPVDGVCANIESRNQGDVALRNQRVVDLSVRLRAATTKPLSIVVVPPVVTQILNTGYWPNFPWQQLAGSYDVWLPMAYWSNRTPESGWRDGYRYIAENTTMIRSLTGNPNAAVHPVGGIGNEITPDEVNAMALALIDTGAIGGSIYDYATTGDALWPSLYNFRR